MFIRKFKFLYRALKVPNINRSLKTLILRCVSEITSTAGLQSSWGILQTLLLRTLHFKTDVLLVAFCYVLCANQLCAQIKNVNNPKMWTILMSALLKNASIDPDRLSRRNQSSKS